MRKNKIIFPILIIIILVFLSGCDNKSTNEDIKSKVVQELDYLDTKIISISNKLNNISLRNYIITSEEITLGEGSSSGEKSSSSGESSGGESSSGESSGGESSSGGGSSSQSGSGGEQEKSNSQSQSGSNTEESKVTTTKIEPDTILESDENDIDWTSIKNEIETINEAWSVVILDLSSLNIDNNDVISFSSILDDTILSIKNQNKADSLTNIAKLYSFIPKFERSISASNSYQNIKQVKSYIINAYSIVEQEDWTGIETNMSECEKTFNSIINDMEYIKDKEYKVNRTYVLIKELQNSLTYKDKKLFYVKYKNLMESINTL